MKIYDVDLFSSSSLKQNYNPFSKEEYGLVVKTCIAITQTYLAQYHNWLAEQLRGSHQAE